MTEYTFNYKENKNYSKKIISITEKKEEFTENTFNYKENKNYSKKIISITKKSILRK